MKNKTGGLLTELYVGYNTEHTVMLMNYDFFMKFIIANKKPN